MQLKEAFIESSEIYHLQELVFCRDNYYYYDDDMFLLKGAEVINITFCAHLIEMPQNMLVIAKYKLFIFQVVIDST